MNNTTRTYSKRFDKACNHLHSGRKDIALDILWELRRKPDICDSRLAAVNLLLAYHVDHEKLKHAWACAELVGSIRRRNGRVSVDTQDLEDHARDYIEQITKKESRKSDAVKAEAGKVTHPRNEAGEGSDKKETQAKSDPVVVMPSTTLSSVDKDDEGWTVLPDGGSEDKEWTLIAGAGDNA